MAFTPPGRTRERVYRYVRQRLLEGRPPSIREVQVAMGFRAVQSAMEHLDRLVEAGRLLRDDGRARSYRLPAGIHPTGTVLVPVFRRVPEYLRPESGRATSPSEGEDPR
jgi:repressor LexA